MRKLQFEIDIEYFKKIKKEIVPTLFTKHQFELIEKRFSKKQLNNTEKSEFSRIISRKMKAINLINKNSQKNMYIYGKEQILPGRIKKAEKILKKYSRKFKNKHIMITGSFLYSKKYKDIDIFIMTKYDKEDYKEGIHHINYLIKEDHNSLFYNSLKKLCISNKKINSEKILEKIDLDTFISLYQEVFNDLDKKHKGIINSLRTYLMQASYIEKKQILDSYKLKQHINIILNHKKPKELIKKIFVNTIIFSNHFKIDKTEFKKLIKSYKELMKEYSQHKQYYEDITTAFEEVMKIEN